MMSSRPSANCLRSSRLIGHGTSDLVEPDAEIVALDLVDAELVERLAHVEIALADRDDADLRLRPPEVMYLLSLLARTKGEHGVALVVVQPRFLPENRCRAGGC
jgi:hypothetical protein